MGRLYRAGDGYSKIFTISDATGAAADADSTPTGTLYVNGAADAATVTITKPATGVYKAAATIPGGLAAGDVVELLIAATVGGVAAKAVVDAVRLVAFDATDAADLGLTGLAGQVFDLAAVMDAADSVEPGESLRQFMRKVRALLYGKVEIDSSGKAYYKRKDGITDSLVVDYTGGFRSEVINGSN